MNITGQWCSVFVLLGHHGGRRTFTCTHFQAVASNFICFSLSPPRCCQTQACPRAHLSDACLCLQFLIHMQTHCPIDRPCEGWSVLGAAEARAAAVSHNRDLSDSQHLHTLRVRRRHIKSESIVARMHARINKSRIRSAGRHTTGPARSGYKTTRCNHTNVAMSQSRGLISLPLTSTTLGRDPWQITLMLQQGGGQI